MKHRITARILITLLITLGALPGIVKAAVTFTLTGEIHTLNGGGSAFSMGEEVTVTLTTLDGLGAPNVENSASNVHWETTNESGDPNFGPLFWSEFTVSGASGSHTTSTSWQTSWLESGDRRNAFYVAAYEDTDNGFGLFRGGEELMYVDAFIGPSSLVSALYGADVAVTPETTFINGTYDVSGATVNSLYFYTDGYAREYIGSVNTITVAGAVPETSSLILMGIAGAVSVLFLRGKLT